MNIKSLIATAVIASSSLTLHAQDLEVTVTNLTQGIHFTPIVIAAHNDQGMIYQTGQAASTELQAMAEGGDISGLVTTLSAIEADIVEDPAGGLLAPSMSVTAMLTNADDNDYLSLAAMMLPTNDGFIGLSKWMIPEEAGTYTFTINAYDAGTEANDEIINGGGAPGVAGIPVAPGGNGGMSGTGVTMTESNETVHIHRGNLGDDDLMGGNSDLDNTVHRWLNPVARITVTVN